MIPEPDEIVRRLRELQRKIRSALLSARGQRNLHQVDRSSSADVIYRLDAVTEPVMDSYFDEWSREHPLIVHAEGMEPDTGRVFPAGAPESSAPIRILLDPIDGTRGLMYDKRAGWSLAGAAPNRGRETRLRDIEVAVMTELPTSKMNQSDVLFAVRGRGAQGVRERFEDRAGFPVGEEKPLPLRPSSADGLAHGFASVTNFFPGTKALAGQLMDELVREMVGAEALFSAEIFDDQYISTGGQFYEMIVGHDRFNADVRPLFYDVLQQGGGFACHPYDAATALIAEEAGVILTDAWGDPLDAPFDLTSPVSWIAYANPSLRRKIEPLIQTFFRRLGARPARTPEP